MSAPVPARPPAPAHLRTPARAHTHPRARPPTRTHTHARTRTRGRPGFHGSFLWKDLMRAGGARLSASRRPKILVNFEGVSCNTVDLSSITAARCSCGRPSASGQPSDGRHAGSGRGARSRQHAPSRWPAKRRHAPARPGDLSALRPASVGAFYASSGLVRSVAELDPPVSRAGQRRRCARRSGTPRLVPARRRLWS